ncbi:Glu-tRNA(Gln) amidotransferase subunit GatD [Halovivax gelatinilyticus]|uniref:Glu-tRNA(Gln) amidotransferase subunit GatD n=1 Tax=Halovivax gelatinilyticus TaxID=2961597 RepID=UPI0020CA896D|nr:Glu-tRNA(Gln) amidotransferase subunit GatD [Halovivax gelatinilyticus]
MNPGDRIRAETPDRTVEGVYLPSSTTDHLVVKLDGGYNVGVERESAQLEVIESDVYDVGGDDASDESGSAIEFDDDLPTISLLSTGGTIASTVDYRTGAVTAQFDAEDVLRAVPDLAGRANYRGRVISNILSENMEPAIWQDLTQAIYEEIDAGADGVVVMHGTDTMQYSGAAVSFALETPVPIVFTGSQRSADRPSSDNVMNAVCAVEAAKSDCAEVLVCMHATESDDVCALHRATRVRKNHTSRRDAFETVSAEPLGAVDYEAVSDATSPSGRAGNDNESEAVSFDGDYRRRDAVELSIEDGLETDAELLKFTPGMDPAFFDVLEGKAGLVVEGTGLGHVHTDFVPRIEALVDDGTTVVVTSQCLDGRVCDRVYDTGRDLLAAGAIEAGDTLPETALVKLMWVLEHAEDDVETLMQTSLAGELHERSVPWT